MNNFSPSSDQLVNVIDDTASSYSGHSSRSNTPSANSDPSEVNEYPMEYLPCSPFSDSNQGSSNSSSPSNSRTSKTISSSSSYSSNFSSSSRHPPSHLPSSSSLPKRMEAALTLCNMNKPLNLASSPRTGEVSDYASRNQNVFNNMHNRGISNRMDAPQQNNFVAPGFVLRSDPEELENIDLLQMDSIWRPW